MAQELELEYHVVDTDYSPESGARETRRLLSAPAPPTAIVYDSDLLAVSGLGVAQNMGFAVPEELSIVGWDDSLISQVVHPPLTAITRDITAYGVTAARRLLASLDGARDRGRRDDARRAHATREHGGAGGCFGQPRAHGPARRCSSAVSAQPRAG